MVRPRPRPRPLATARRALAAALLLAVPAGSAMAQVKARDWQPVERIETYRVEGATGIDLYRSIGARAPSAGVGQAIAFTDFELLWSRDYQNRLDGSCVLASARPSLTIIYRWPEAPSGLPADVAASWQRFIEGVERHERVHGDHVIEMTEKIKAFSTGLSAEADPTCDKVRAKLQAFLATMAAERLARARDFDRAEMSDGGNVHALILALVNGP